MFWMICARLPIVATLIFIVGCAADKPASESHAAARSATFSRFIVALDQSVPAALSDSAGLARSATERVVGHDWSVDRSEAGALLYEVAPSGDAGALAAGEPLTMGAAWQKAYDLQQQPGVEYAEPIFLTQLDPGEEQLEQDWCPPDVGALVALGGQEPKNLPDALRDREWSLGPKGANVKEAWKLFAARNVVPGAGVVIGHPDTGYRRHPEIWSSEAATSAIHPENGWDFVDNNDDPLDELDNVRLPGGLAIPGHGTRTSSVIVSPAGSQLLADAPRWVSGVAPGAYLVPLRVSPVVLDMGKLAAAIRNAAGEDRRLVKRKADVISMSLGGLPSRMLRDAIEFAIGQNVIVLAASGNHVRTVVWRGRYRDVLAVAASNVAGAPWSGSSRGKRVDITAPGESVWCASTRPDAGRAHDCLQVSSGTSFAVATTAGIAAL